MDAKEIIRELDRLLSEGKHREAEVFLKEQILTAKRTRNASLLLTLLNEQEGIYRNTGRADEAVKSGETALELITALGLTGSRFHAVTLLNSATACRMAGQYDQAVKYYTAALEILNREDPKDAGLLAACCNNLSQVYQDRREEETALLYLEKAYGLITSVPGKTAETAITAQNMAVSLMALGRMKEAEDRISEAGNYFLSETGLKDRHLGSFYSTAAEYFMRSGQQEKALNHPARASEKFEKARENYRKALEINLRLYGENDAAKRIRSNLRFLEKQNADSEEA